MNLLIVDDDPKQHERYKIAIGEFNAAQQTAIRFDIRENVDSGIKSLDLDYDGAVIDLRLSQSTPNAEGNRVIKEIRQRKRFPVVVLTGFPGDLDPDLKEELDSGPNFLFQMYKRDRQFSEVLAHLLTVHRSGIFQIMGPNGLIEKALNEVFWSHLSRTLEYWRSQPLEPVTKRTNRLLRFSLSHLSSKLDRDTDGALDDYYPDEMYIIPALTREWQTGDLIKANDRQCNFVVVTPACDLAQDKAKGIHLVEIESLREGVFATNLNLCKRQPEATPTGDEKVEFEKKQRSAREVLIRLACNSYGNRYHFLPPSRNFEGGLLNFQKVQSVKFTEFGKNFTKIGSISDKFIKDIVSRFASYYARQGQPNFECEKIISGLIAS